MKVLEVAPYFAPAWAYGGVPRSVYELSMGLSRRNHQVTVLTTDALSARERMPHTYVKNDLEIHYQRNLSNYLVWRHRLLSPIGISAFLRKRIHEFDIIHIHGFRMYQSVVVHRQALKSGIPYLVSAHGELPRIVRKVREKGVFDKLFGERVLRDASRVTALSRAEKVVYESMGVPSSRISVVYNAIDATSFQNLPPRGQLRQELGLGSRKVVTYIGRLNARKGLDVLLRSFLILERRRRDLALLLVGEDDGYRRTLERLIAEHAPEAPVIFAGLITLPKKLNVLVDSDVVVYPSQHEFFGLVPFEALLCGRPIVVTGDSGCGEIVSDAKAGRIVAYGDEAELADAIEGTLDGGKETDEMTDRGRQYVMKHMSLDEIGRKVEALYLEASQTWNDAEDSQ